MNYVVWCIAFAALLANIFWPQPYDDTDAKDHSSRSGVVLITDHGTGCQYLARFGVIVPRMDTTGKQVCKQ